ncbi:MULTISPECIES: helix-turn-helix domain-containing protein [Streptomyces]
MRLAGPSQRRLAQQAHVSQAFISMVVRGRRGVRPVTAWRMASALGATSANCSPLTRTRAA